MRLFRYALLVLILASSNVSVAGQTPSRDEAGNSWTFDTYTPGPCSPTGARHGGCNPGEVVRIAVTTIASDLVQPWHLTFLPGTTDLLATELPGRLRIIRNGVLDPAPVPGWPVPAIPSRSLHSVVLHPRFADNRTVYLTYSKGKDAQTRTPTTVAIARARFDGKTLSAVEQIFEADAWGGGSSPARAEFGPDGMLYFAIGVRDSMNSSDDASDRIKAQQLTNHAGKVLRLTDEGRAPRDNPFVGKAGVKPEIYTYGHRNLQGFTWHPDTREMWATEIGPMGGDELNRLVPGGNYGWPVVSLGKIYNSNLVSEQPWWRPGIEMPVMFWAPAISPSSILIYSGNRFPQWKGHFFIGALSGQQLQRVAFNQPPPQTERRESMLVPLDARVRDVRQAPDGTIYIAVERDTQLGPGSTKLAPTGSILRIAPADAAQQSTAGCDRECLRGKVTELLHALVKHDISGLPVGAAMRVTEDAVEKPLANVGLVKTVTRLRGFRQDIIDERAGVAGAHVVVEESGAPVMLVVRLKVAAGRLTEVELVATRNSKEGLIFNIDGLSAPSEVTNYAPRAEQLPTRDEAIKAALKYPEGLSAAKTFAAVNAPFAPNAYRFENGQVMAGPDCKFAPGCQNISTQSLAIFERLGDPQTRVIAVDERMGIVWLRMAWGVQKEGGDQLTVWETFKVFDGQIHAVEAFMRILPVEKRNGGWE